MNKKKGAVTFLVMPFPSAADCSPLTLLCQCSLNLIFQSFRAAGGKIANNHHTEHRLKYDTFFTALRARSCFKDRRQAAAPAQPLDAEAIRTTGVAGGLYRPCKGLLPAALIELEEVRQSHHFPGQPLKGLPGILFVCWQCLARKRIYRLKQA